MFRRILVPIDGSYALNLGLEEAIEMAMDQDARLCLLHVVDELVVTQNLDGTIYAPPSYIDEFLNALREGGEKILAKAEAKVRKRGVKTDACW
jgi:nucleotide-binding universal stress UspA family protein